MKRIVCGLILGSIVAQCHAGDLFPEEPETLERYELHAAHFDVLLINTLTPEGEAQLLAIATDEQALREPRLTAIQKLANCSGGCENVRRTLLELLTPATDKFTCQEVIASIKRMDVPADEALPALLRVVHDMRSCSVRGCSSGAVSARAIEAIEAYGAEAAAEAIPVLERIATHQSPGNSTAASMALGRLAPSDYPFFAQGKAAVLPLAAKLASEDPAEAREAAWRLVRMHELAAPAVPALKMALDHPDGGVRMVAAATLLAMGSDHAAAIQTFDTEARASRGTDRRCALILIRDYQLPCDELPLLVESLSDPDTKTRVLAARTLAKREKHEPEALAVLMELYNTGEPSNQLAAILAMDSFRPESLAPARELIEQAVEAKVYRADRLLKTKFPEAPTSEGQP